MPPRTTTSYVTFAYPFVMAGHTDELPPGKYQVIAEDEVLESLSFAAYRRTATHLLIKGPKGTGQMELRPIDHRDLELALAQDQACSSKLMDSEAALSPPEDIK